MGFERTATKRFAPWPLHETPGQPEPIEIKTDKTATIEINFDDTIKMGG